MEILVFETVTYVKIKICSSKPSSIDSWFIKPLSLSFTLRIKIWVVAILSQKRKKENIKEIICNFWVWMLQYLNQQLSFCPQKVEKATLKSYSEIIRIFFFHFCPELSKLKNSCFKMWLTDQLYIKLGIKSLKIVVDCFRSVHYMCNWLMHGSKDEVQNIYLLML